MFHLPVLVLPMLVILGMFVTNAAAAVTNVFVERIEVTQAVQCLDVTNGYTKCPDNSLELDSDRAVVVRVYIGHEGVPACPGGNLYEPVSELKQTKVKLWWAAAHAPNYIWPLGYTDEKTFNVPCSKDLKDLRNDGKGSATFIIPAEKLGKPLFEKALRVEAEVVPPVGVQDSSLSDNKMMIQLGHKDDQGNDLPGGIFPHDLLDVQWLPINYRPNDSTVYEPYAGPQWMADFTKPAKDVGYMKSLYPMPIYFRQGFGFLLYGSNPITGATCATCPDIRDSAAARSTLAGKLGYARTLIKPSPDVLVGYLPDEAIAQPCGKGGTHGGAWVNDCGSQETDQVILAHEVGHTQNVWHTSDSAADGEPCWPFPGSSLIQEAGYSFLTGKIVSSDTGDFMEPPATGDEWISPYMWNRLLGKPLSKEWSTCDLTSSKAAFSPLKTAATGPVILISGSILEDGSGQLAPLFVFTDEGPFPTSNPGAPYCVDLQASDGSSLATHCFDLPKTRSAIDVDSSAEEFSYLLPFPPLAARVVLFQGATILDQRAATQNAPDLTVDQPYAGDVDPAEVSWTASDVDGDDLTFIVLYSPDGNTSQTPIAIDIGTTGASTGLAIDSGLMAGGSNALFRVLASDGFNTTAVDSARFQITPKPPMALIHAPVNGTLVDFTGDLILAGYGGDMEDGELTGASLQWESSRNGTLGEGSEIVLSAEALTPGPHLISLVATDSDGMTATASVTVSVFLPVEIDIKPSTDRNPVNPGSRGKLKVAILTTDAFDASTVDAGTARMGLDGAEPVWYRLDDVDYDGDLDLVLKFNTQDTGIACGDTEATLTGQTIGGVQITGTDSLRTVGCPE